MTGKMDYKTNYMKQKIKDALGKGRGKLPRLRRRSHDVRINQALENLPRITNETVAEHREEMLSSARKFIYPLQHSRGRIVKISVLLAIVGVIAFLTYVLVALYKFQSNSTFVYGVTRVLPFPVAKAGGAWVSYESYLFELRRFVHYYETQQEADFSSEDGRSQLDNFKERSLQAVIDDAYIKQLANDNGVTVSNREVDDAVALLREQNRLGGSDEEFRDVLREFWGWTVDDFRRELRQQILAQKVVAKLDTQTGDRARQAEARLKGGEPFAKVATEMSDDELTKGSGGEYAFLVDRSNPNLSPKVVDELFRLTPGQTSAIIDTGYALEIVRVNSTANDKLRAAHISFSYRPAGTFIKPVADKEPPQRYIKLEAPRR